MSNSLPPCGLCSLPSSSVHEILQARVLKWVSISFSMNEAYFIKNEKQETQKSFCALEPHISLSSGKPPLTTMWNLPNIKHIMYLHLFKASSRSYSMFTIFKIQNLYLLLYFILFKFCKWYCFLIWASNFLFSRSNEIFYTDNRIIYK